MRKKIFLILIFCVLLTGCKKQTEKNELNVLNWSSYIPDEVIREFEDQTGIIVNYGTYSSNEECLAKVQSSKSGTYDLIFPSDYMVSLLIERNMLEIIDKTKIQNISNIKENYLNLSYDPNNMYSLPFLAATTIIAYNKDNIKENITSYNDLLNPKYKNNIVILDDQRVVIGMALQALGYDMNSTDKNELEEAKNWLMKLKPNIKAYDSDSPKTFLISHEADIGIMWNAEATIAYEENKSIKLVYPSEGFNISIDNYVILKGSKNKDNAYRFINYLLDANVMKKIIESYPYHNVNQETEQLLSNEYKENIATNTPLEILERAHFVKNIGSSILSFDKVWAEIK